MVRGLVAPVPVVVPFKLLKPPDLGLPRLSLGQRQWPLPPWVAPLVLLDVFLGLRLPVRGVRDLLSLPLCARLVAVLPRLPPHPVDLHPPRLVQPRQKHKPGVAGPPLPPFVVLLGLLPLLAPPVVLLLLPCHVLQRVCKEALRATDAEEPGECVLHGGTAIGHVAIGRGRGGSPEVVDGFTTGEGPVAGGNVVMEGCPARPARAGAASLVALGASST